MALSDIRDPAHVLKAIDECDQKGMDAFLKHYGFGPAQQYKLVYLNGRYRLYPSKAILGVSHRFAHPSGKPLRHTDFTGGLSQTIPVLKRLGFKCTGRNNRLPPGNAAPSRAAVSGSRIIRDTAVVRAVKELYGYCCQICGLRLDLPGGPYSEGAHIKPLGQPHGGPDEADNVLCLCPNCHVLFDAGAIAISGNWRILGRVPALKGRVLRRVDRHNLNPSHIKYHRDLVGARSGNP